MLQHIFVLCELPELFITIIYMGLYKGFLLFLLQIWKIFPLLPSTETCWRPLLPCPCAAAGGERIEIARWFLVLYYHFCPAETAGSSVVRQTMYRRRATQRCIMVCLSPIFPGKAIWTAVQRAKRNATTPPHPGLFCLCHSSSNFFFVTLCGTVTTQSNKSFKFSERIIKT